MESEHFMPKGAMPLIAALLGCGLVATARCVRDGPLRRPAALVSPHAARQVWAVAPFTNESGDSSVAGDRVADLFTQQLQQAWGIDTVPVNRVIFAMRALGMPAVVSPGDARLLVHALDVDALVVGTVTAWEPYPPPLLGLGVAVFPRGRRPWSDEVDVFELARAIREGQSREAPLEPPGAAFQAAGVFDSSNHQVLAWLREYAAGRTEPQSAFGADIHLMSMESFTRFVSYRLIHDLFADERARQMPLASTPASR
jgi:hypothetical protein